MAKRSPYIAVQTDIRKEERVAVLGDVAGYSEFEALGRIITLWAWCADRKLENAPADSDGYAVSEAVIRRFLGQNGVEAILGGGCDDFALGVRRPDGLIYLRGTSETVRNLRAHAKGAVSGGESRHASGGRENGRFVSQPTIVQPTHQPDSSAPPAPLQLNGTETPAGSSVDPRSQIPDPEEDSLSRAIPPSTTATPEPVTNEAGDMAERQAARSMLWRELGDLRSRLCADLRLSARPLPVIGDPGERALAAHFAEAGSRGTAGVIADARHAMAVLEAEARRDGSVQWVTGAIFEDRSWRRVLGMTVDDAKRARPPLGSGRDRANQQPPTNRPKTVIL